MKEPETIFAIGHSTREIGDFTEIIQAHGINLLADIRTIPKSRHNPQFNQDFLKKQLKANKIRYRHLKELGGLRHAKRDSVNKAWKNANFRGFADYMQTREFSEALRQLIELGKRNRIAIMCAEGNPFRCHRSLVADALTIRKVRVLHISSRTSTRKHTLTRFAAVEGKMITYPAPRAQSH